MGREGGEREEKGKGGGKGREREREGVCTIGNRHPPDEILATPLPYDAIIDVIASAIIK